MAAPVISRLVLTDDDGTGLTGTPLNNQLFQDLQNRIDQLSAALYAQLPVLPAGIVTTASLPGSLATVARQRTLTLTGYGPGGIQIDASLYDCVVCNGQVGTAQFVPPIWSGAGGIAPRDEASLVIRLRDNGTSVGITWTDGGVWVVPMLGIPMPTATVPLKMLHVGLRYSALHNAWFCVAIATD